MQPIFNGLAAAGPIALLAVAFQIVYLPTRIFFLGLAGVYALTPYVAREAFDRGWGWFASILSALAAATAMSLLCEAANHARLSRRCASEGVQLIASLGLYLVITQIVVMIWGSGTRALRLGLDTVTIVAGLSITASQVIMAIVAVGVLAAFAVFLRRAELGLRLRALASSPASFAILGYDVDAYRRIAFAISGLLSAMAALTSAYDVGFEPYGGLHAVLLAVVAVIIGGRAGFAGPVLGAVVLGVLRAQVSWTWSSNWLEPTTFLLLAGFLLVRPHGLLGRPNRLEAAA
jgi:branched-chain amino acid transport system permease protein